LGKDVSGPRLISIYFCLRERTDRGDHRGPGGQEDSLFTVPQGFKRMSMDDLMDMDEEQEGEDAAKQ
jgi:hypothetical protein